MDFWQYEKEAMAEGHAAVCGCDEAGAGPLAGPVCAAAVVLVTVLLASLSITRKRPKDILTDLS